MPTVPLEAWSFPSNPRKCVSTKLFANLKRVFTYIGLVILLICGFFGLRDIGELKSLDKDGVLMKGRIDNRYYSSGKSTTYYIEYSWVVNGNEYNGKDPVGWSRYEDSRIGDPVTLTVLPANPIVHRLGAVDDDYLAHSLKVWIGATLGFAGLFFLLRIFVGVSYVRESHLLENGYAVPALIKRIKVTTKKGAFHLVEYEATVEGQTISKKASVDPAAVQSMKEGEYTTYLYSRDRPTKGRLFEEITLQKLA